jgi:hypothetical protein
MGLMMEAILHEMKMIHKMIKTQAKLMNLKSSQKVILRVKTDDKMRVIPIPIQTLLILKIRIMKDHFLQV